MASPRERKTADGINGGLTTKAAMIAAGYGETYADRFAGSVLKRLEAEGLVRTEADVRDVKDRVNAIFRDNAEAVATALVTAATAGDVVAQKAVLDRAAGPVPKRHEVSMEDVGTVAADLLAAAARELDPETFERLRAVWQQRLEERKRP